MCHLYNVPCKFCVMGAYIYEILWYCFVVFQYVTSHSMSKFRQGGDLQLLHGTAAITMELSGVRQKQMSTR